jgi:hypothetical protein
LTAAGVGSGSVALATAFTPGQAVSNAALTPGLLTPGGQAIIGVGAMSAAYGGLAPTTYEATAVFDFTTTSASEALDLNLLSEQVVGIGFDSQDLQVALDGNSLTGSGGAETFFTADQFALGTVSAGSHSVSLTYDLTYNSGTQAVVTDGFSFTYELVDPPVASVPEPSSWAMMLVGFAGLGLVGYRASHNGARSAPPPPLSRTPSISG